MKVINFWAGPGSGKSTTAAGLFFAMKNMGVRCELVTEFAKELVYEKSETRLRNQLMLFAEQDSRLRRLIGQVDFAITDSPLPLTSFYAKPPFDEGWFTKAVAAVFNKYDNYNYFVRRVKPYDDYGRYQTAAEARELDAHIWSHMVAHTESFQAVNGEAASVRLIMRDFFE